MLHIAVITFAAVASTAAPTVWPTVGTVAAVCHRILFAAAMAAVPVVRQEPIVADIKVVADLTACTGEWE